PLIVSFAVMAGVGVYQMAGHVMFLNETVYAVYRRASGTLFDANVFGTLAALWIGGIAVWADRFTGERSYVRAAGVITGWAAVWASGSRTAAAAATIITLFIVGVAFAERRRAGTRWSRAG